MPLTANDLLLLLDDLRQAAEQLQQAVAANPTPPALVLARSLVAVAGCTAKLRNRPTHYAHPHREEIDLGRHDDEAGRGQVAGPEALGS
jgi:hypothetical protein